MYLIDTNIISELRKKDRADSGVTEFFQQAIEKELELFISTITVGELRRGIELIRHRGDESQADILERWFDSIIIDFSSHILDFTEPEAQTWGYLRVPHYENALDKQIAATALTHDLILVTRNTADFLGTGVQLLNPFKKKLSSRN